MSLAPIERLPVELLQPIFLLADANVSLPAASHHIAAKLSSAHIYHAVCMHHLTNSSDSPVQQSRSQSRIFAAKWMTWDFFKSFVLKFYGLNGCLCGKTRETGCFDPIWPPHFEDATGMVFSRSHLSALSFVKCRIPTKLLRGPWTNDKVQFLRFLLWTTSMTVDWADDSVRITLLEGKKTAILQGNFEAVELFNHNRRLGKPPGLQQVRFAVMEAGCNRSIVYDTMATARHWGTHGNAWNCAILDRWCEERLNDTSNADYPKAAWLQLKLKELRTISDAAIGSGGVAKKGYMDPRSGDYEAVAGDKLVIRPHRWNEVSSCRFRSVQMRAW